MTPISHPDKWEWDFAIHPDSRSPNMPIVLKPVGFIPPRGLEMFWYTKLVNNKNDLYRFWYKKGLLVGDAKNWMEEQLIKAGREDLILEKEGINNE